MSGDDAFKLYDTYGFPLELTQEIAEESGIAVDVAGFEAAMQVQQETSKGAHETIDLTVQCSGRPNRLSTRDRAEVHIDRTTAVADPTTVARESTTGFRGEISRSGTRTAFVALRGMLVIASPEKISTP